MIGNYTHSDCMWINLLQLAFQWKQQRQHSIKTCTWDNSSKNTKTHLVAWAFNLIQCSSPQKYFLATLWSTTFEVIRHREIKCSSRMHSSSISSNLSFDKRYLFVGSSFHDCISCILFESLNEALWIFWRQSHNIWQPSGLYLISGLCNFCSWPEKLDVELRSEIVFRRLKCLYQDQNVNNLWKCKRRGGWKIQKD